MTCILILGEKGGGGWTNTHSRSLQRGAASPHPNLQFTLHSCRIEKTTAFLANFALNFKKNKTKLCFTLSSQSMSRKTQPHTEKSPQLQAEKRVSPLFFFAQTTRCYTTPTHSIPSEKTVGGGGGVGRTDGGNDTQLPPAPPPAPYQARRNNIKVFSCTCRRLHVLSTVRVNDPHPSQAHP